MVFDLHNDLMTAVPAEKRNEALASCAAEGMSDYSDFPALTADMEKAGFGRQDIENIFYGNAERFFRIRQGA